MLGNEISTADLRLSHTFIHMWPPRSNLSLNSPGRIRRKGIERASGTIGRFPLVNFLQQTELFLVPPGNKRALIYPRGQGSGRWAGDHLALETNAPSHPFPRNPWIRFTSKVLPRGYAQVKGTSLREVQSAGFPTVIDGFLWVTAIRTDA